MTSNLTPAGIKLSVVATLYRSAPFLEEFYSRISTQAKKLTPDYEIILVDDGSPDNSLELALKLLEKDSHLKIIELSRNFGHHKAMMTGLEQAEGELVFLIDSDLEEPPELLEQFYEKLLGGGWDVVYGQQEKRKGGVFEKLSGAIVWWLFSVLLPRKIPTNHSTVRLMKRNYTRALVSHKEQKTAIGGLWIETGFKQTGLIFAKLSRSTTSYGLGLRLVSLLDSVTSFSERPLYFVFFLGLLIFSISVAVATGLFIYWCGGVTLPGWISIMVSIWLLGGLSIFCIGLVGLYVSRIFIETKCRPYTIIRNVYKSQNMADNA